MNLEKIFSENAGYYPFRKLFQSLLYSETLKISAVILQVVLSEYEKLVVNLMDEYKCV
jgi:hypothetical protein